MSAVFCISIRRLILIKLLLFSLSSTLLPAQSSTSKDSLRQLILTAKPVKEKMFFYLQLISQLDIKKEEQELYQLKADFLEVAKPAKAISDIEQLYEIIGQKLSNTSDLILAKKNYQELAQVMTELKSPHGSAKTCFLLGKLSMEMGELDEGIEFMHNALTLYEPLENVELDEAEVHNYLATIYLKQGEFKYALEWYHKAKKIVQHADDDGLMASILNGLGRLYRKQAVYDSAMVYYQQSLELNIKIDNKKGIAASYNNLGNISQIKGDLAGALTHYINSLKLKEELGFPRGIGLAYHNIAAVRLDLGELELAKKDFEKSLQIANEIEFKILKIHNLLKLGVVSRDLGNIKKAMKFHQQAIKDSEQMKFEQGLMEGKLYLAQDYYEARDYKAALDTYYEGLSLAEKNDRKDYISICLLQIANCYMGLQQLTQEGGNLSSTYQDIDIEALLLRGTAIAREIGARENMTASFEALQEFYHNNRNYQKEAQVTREFNIYKDSLFEKQKIEAIAEWSIKYNTAEKEKAILVLQNEKKLEVARANANRNKFIGGILFLLTLSLAGLVYFNVQSKLKRAKTIESLRTKISSDLHDDVGSILAGLSMQTELLQYSLPEEEKHKMERITNLSKSAMSGMRDAVWAMDSRRDKFSDLIDRMREFAEETLGQAEIPYSLNFSGIDADKIIFPDIRQNLYFIFKEALTNIIRHSSAKEVKISLENSSTQFKMLIKNDGLLSNKTIKSSGLGTSNMQLRAKNINAKIAISMTDAYAINLEMAPLT